MTISNNPLAPKPIPPVKPPVEKPTQVAPSYTFKDDLANKAQMPREFAEAVAGPGDALNLMSGKKLSEVRSKLDLKEPYKGVHAPKGQTPTVDTIKNPDSPDGTWDPHQFMPRFAFDPKEDAFPVSPTFDGDLDLQNNGPDQPNGTDGNYQDGVIGGKQPLSGAFTVTKKGDYHVLTYSFYSATNKAVHYHNNDYATAQVFLKPGKDGKLEPTHLATSWHHGSQLTKWEDLAKDEQGKPVVKVHRGSHALQPIGDGDDIPEAGLQIAGDGSVSKDGETLPHTLGFEAFQTNVKGATYKDPKDPTSAPRLEAMRWGEAAMNPFLPEIYEDAPNPVLEFGGRLFNNAVDKVESTVETVADKVEDGAETVVDKAKDVAGGLKDTGEKLVEKLPFL